MMKFYFEVIILNVINKDFKLKHHEKIKIILNFIQICKVK